MTLAFHYMFFVEKCMVQMKEKQIDWDILDIFLK